MQCRFRHGASAQSLAHRLYVDRTFCSTAALAATRATRRTAWT